MSRYIQSDNRPKPKKEEKPERTLPKAGKYTSENLQGIKKVHSGTGGKY